MPKPGPAILTIGFLSILACSSAVAGTPRLIRDINDYAAPVGSYPTDFANLGPVSAFSADDGVRGYEPWTSDGTTAGTFAWGDLNPDAGTIGRTFTMAGGPVFSLHSDYDRGPVLWVSGGAPESTRLVIDSLPNVVNAGPVGALGDEFVFTAFNLANSAREFWVSDGTAAGTRRVTSATGEWYSAVDRIVVDRKIYFLSPTEGIPGAWVTDGTPAGTKRLAQIPHATADQSIASMARAGNHVFFSVATAQDSGHKLWKIDIRDDSVSQVTDVAIAPNSAAIRFGTAGDVLVFSSETPDTGLWRSDGTASGTYPIASVGVSGVSPWFVDAPALGRTLFFVSGAGGLEAWGTDGSAAGTQRLGLASADSVRRIGSRFFFSNLDGTEVWTSDGTTDGTRQLQGILAAGEAVTHLAGDDAAIYVRSTATSGASRELVGRIYRRDLATSATLLLASMDYSERSLVHVFRFAQGRLYFDNEDPVHGRELWTSDGTVAGTRMLKNLAPETVTPPSAPKDLVRFDGQLFFTADDGTHGREVWYSDGTYAGTQLLVDINPGAPGSSPQDLFVAAGHLYFFAKDADGNFRLWLSDGTVAGTTPVSDVDPRPISGREAGCDSKGVVLGGVAYFAGRDASAVTRLWRTDGTNAGTVPVSNVPSSPFRRSAVCHLTVLGDRLYFVDDAGPDAGGEEIWSTNGTPSGTELLADIWPGESGSYPATPRVLGHRLYFLASDGVHGRQLWTSDGTTAGTHAVAGFGDWSAEGLQGPASGRFLVPVDNFDGVRLIQGLWTTDGVTAEPLADVIDIRTPVFPMNGKLAFFGVMTHGEGYPWGNPWVSDGTVGGTFPLLDPGTSTKMDSPAFGDFNGITVFQADDPAGVQMFWRTNGTRAGTLPIAPFTGSWRDPAAVGQDLFFVGNDGVIGDELYALDNERPASGDDDLGTIPARGSAEVNVVANDIDPDGTIDAGSVVISIQPAGGSVSVAADGTIAYTARAGFSGTDSFSYAVADDQGYFAPPAAVHVEVSTPEPGTGDEGNSGLNWADLALLGGVLLARSRAGRRGAVPGLVRSRQGVAT